jgi:hypothetical protein
LDILAGWGSVFFKLIPLCSVRPLFYAIFRGFKVSPWGHYSCHFFCIDSANNPVA